MLLALLAALPLQVPIAVQEIQSHVGRTPWVVSVGLADWKEAPDGNPLAKELGDKLVLNGTCAPEGTTLTLIAEPNPQMISPAAWRKRFAIPGTEFDIQLSACVDASIKEPKDPKGPTLSDYHAFTCAAAWCFDLHVSRVSADGKEALSRDAFERIVRSTRYLLLRRGWQEHYPEQVGYQMTLAALAGPGRSGWKEKILPQHEEDWIAHFVEAEFLRLEKAPVQAQIAQYQRSLDLATKLEKPGPKELFATAIVCDGLSLALHDAGKYAESIAPLEQGYKLLAGMNRRERGALAYNLACSQALLKKDKEALAALSNAISADAHFRDAAAQDLDLAALRDLPEFQKLVGKPAK